MASGTFKRRGLRLQRTCLSKSHGLWIYFPLKFSLLAVRLLHVVIPTVYRVCLYVGFPWDSGIAYKWPAHSIFRKGFFIIGTVFGGLKSFISAY